MCVHRHKEGVMALLLHPKRSGRLLFNLATILLLVATTGATQAAMSAAASGPQPTFSTAKAFDVSPTLRELAGRPARQTTPRDLPEERGPLYTDRGFA